MCEVNTSQLKVGDMVKYKTIVDAGDDTARFIIVELNGDRGYMQLVCDMNIKPVDLFRIAGIERA